MPRRWRRLAAAAALLVAAAAGAREPALPEGLGGDPGAEGPALPAGLGASATRPAEGPALPAGLGEAQPPATRPERGRGPGPGLELSGFWSLRVGPYARSAPRQEDLALGETRLQIEAEKRVGGLTFRLKNDLLYDPVAETQRIDLETGRGWLDLREASVAFTPLSFMDVEVGRQVLTWGTGDLVFLNDLFPKDWSSFLIGRDVSYLKAPSDAAKVSLYGELANLDVVYTPAFDADRFVDGRRVTFFDPARGRRAGRGAPLAVDERSSFFADDEWALRLHRRIGRWETAAYFYDGFWKSPAGRDPDTGRATFPPLRVWGASVRGPAADGIANAEVAYYDSLDDRDGDDPTVANRELRLLLGYQREVAANLTLGGQYYLERVLDADAFRASVPRERRTRDATRHVVTARVTLLTMMQNLEWSLFAFYSPSDDDAYLRPKATYQVDDHWRVQLGANVFLGNSPRTFFGQFRDNANVYLGLRYSF